MQIKEMANGNHLQLSICDVRSLSPVAANNYEEKMPAASKFQLSQLQIESRTKPCTVVLRRCVWAELKSKEMKIKSLIKDKPCTVLLERCKRAEEKLKDVYIKSKISSETWAEVSTTNEKNFTGFATAQKEKIEYFQRFVQNFMQSVHQETLRKQVEENNEEPFLGFEDVQETTKLHFMKNLKKSTSFIETGHQGTSREQDEENNEEPFLGFEDAQESNRLRFKKTLKKVTSLIETERHTCKPCGKLFTSISQMMHHQRKCKYKRVRFTIPNDQPIPSDVQHHAVQLQEKTLTSRKIFICPVCKAFQTNHTIPLQQHLSAHSGKKAFKCKSFISALKSTTHKRKHEGVQTVKVRLE